MATTTVNQLPDLVPGPSGTMGFWVHNPNLMYADFVPVGAGENPQAALQSYINTYKGSSLIGGAGAGGAGVAAGAGVPAGAGSTASAGAAPAASSYLGGAATGAGSVPSGFQLMSWPSNVHGPTYYNPATKQVYVPGISAQPLSVYKWGQGPGNALISAFNQQQAQQAIPPESTALGQMAQIDPASEALRQQLAGSYATPLSQAQAPSAANVQSYLDMYKQLDPTTYAALQGLGPGFQSYLQNAQNQAALGSTLDPITQMQLQQQVRAAQGARGNVYGTPQLVEEAMTTGQAGLALQQQRQQNLANALGAQQSYLGSGITPGAIGLNLYQQNLSNLRGAQQAAQSYLGSGQTPYQAGAGYLANAQNMANASSQGFSMGQPAGLAPSYSYLNPAYGQGTAQTGQAYYQTMSNLYGQNLAYGQQGKSGGIGSALGGAVSGAASGAALGSIIPGVGTVVGGIAGGLLGGAGGYFAAYDRG